MAPIWPFNRKKTGVPKAKPAEEKKVVSYEREQGDAQKEKLEDRVTKNVKVELLKLSKEVVCKMEKP